MGPPKRVLSAFWGEDGALSEAHPERGEARRTAPMSKRSKSTNEAKCDWQALTAEQRSVVRNFRKEISNGA